MPLLECREVCKHFGALAAVDRLSFALEEGQILGIGGPNGAGKTTLFEMISGLHPATSGAVLLEGRDITRLAPEAICHAGVARTFQHNAGFDSLTARENVLVAAQFGVARRRFPGLAIGREAQAAADEALAAVGLSAQAGTVTANLPVLGRKLLMIASALATRPRLLMLDEPAGGLTAAEIDQLIEVVRRIERRGISIVLIEHVMRFLVTLAHRVMIMHHGEKIYEGASAGLTRDAKVVEVYLGAGAAARLQAAMATQAGPMQAGAAHG
ncbi:MAG: ATP-binding cassette domain-containing protein [Burkholderiales bacterium]|nr:ATP-binding cassette domain-containing protein [Burkholderiales bacterium]